MDMNVGRTDQVLRLIGAAVIFALGCYFLSWWGLLGLIPLATGLSRRCPPYAMLGMSTCRTRKENGSSTIS
jgi:cadmium resistance protein CadD (predicted permease)